MPVDAKPVVKIALFNHKGGVSKTTTTFNLGWKLAAQGHRVVLVDADPQCNLTGMVLGYTGANEIEDFYNLSNGTGGTIRSGVVPAFEAQPRPIEPVPLTAVPQREGLYLLAGDLRISEYETTLGIAQELSGAIQALKNLPGSLSFMIDRSAEAIEADVVLIDMSPGLGPINQNLVSTSDYVIIPSAPDFFSVMAMDSLSRVLPRWNTWAQQASALPVLRDAAYPFPEPRLKLIGTIIQKFRPRAGQPAAAFQRWIDEVGEAVRTKLAPALGGAGLLLPEELYASNGISDDFCLAQIAEFNSLIAKSQEFLTPVFALSAAQLGAVGSVQENWETSRDAFNQQFESLATRVMNVVTASGSADVAS
ncbi:AAA family ATPase [Jatrophihabitans telluris]|uniref:AAA family ATPase n=1 Tax=Jatrophihabitans telluris TaxID=2038343 RepID=A0ABY4QWV6_9ACTN|nr:ParA family protein [Jatrophihabitans telluris]UQX87652.1 AAA family ATPase [Jatrophihabitans telluris]